MTSQPPTVGAVVFDLDGTLVDSAEDIARCANYALQHHGFAPLPHATLQGYIGDGARKLIARACGRPEHSDTVAQLLPTFLAYYEEHAAAHTQLMPGAAKALAALVDLPLALCTNKPRTVTDRLLAALDLTSAFRVVVAGGDLPVHKPDPALLTAVAGQLGVPPASLVMVGDGPQDVASGKAVGCRTVGVRGGILDEALLIASEPDALLDGLDELEPLIRRWQHT